MRVVAASSRNTLQDVWLTLVATDKGQGKRGRRRVHGIGTFHCEHGCRNGRRLGGKSSCLWHEIDLKKASERDRNVTAENTKGSSAGRLCRHGKEDDSDRRMARVEGAEAKLRLDDSQVHRLKHGKGKAGTECNGDRRDASLLGDSRANEGGHREASEEFDRH